MQNINKLPKPCNSSYNHRNNITCTMPNIKNLHQYSIINTKNNNHITNTNYCCSRNSNRTQNTNNILSNTRNNHLKILKSSTRIKNKMNAAYFDQFNLKKLLYIKYRETILRIRNLTLTLFVIILLIITINKRQKILPNRNTIIISKIFEITNNLTNEHINKKQLTYNPLIYTIFTIFTTINIMGLLPYVFTTTSHIIITFSLSLTIIIKTTIRAILTHKTKFFRILTPHSAPLILTPFLVLIETTRYITRAVSLGVRLAANISAGHLLLAILSNFALNTILTNNYLLRIIPITALFLIRLLEIIVALIQAYVFTLLTTIYLSDTIKLH